MIFLLRVLLRWLAALFDKTQKKLSPLANLKKLVALEIKNTADITPLANLYNLKLISMGGIYITSLASLRELSELEGIWCAKTPIFRTFISFEKITKIRLLWHATT